MHLVLPVLESIESVDFGSSESNFGTSVSSATLARASEISPSGSWINSYVPSANRLISIMKCNSWKKYSKVLYLSIAFLHDTVENSIIQTTQIIQIMYSNFTR